MAQATLLVELLTEELPPKSLRKLSEVFAKEIHAGLLRERLADGDSKATAFATPRRLAVSVDRVADRGVDSIVELKGPTVAVGLDERGQPKPALIGFAKKCGVEVAGLSKASDAKGEYFLHRQSVTGAALAAVIGRIVEEAAKKLPVAKSMRWGDGEAQFVRPVKGVLILHGAEHLPAEVLSIQSKTPTTLGHRVLAMQTPVRVTSAQDYEKSLVELGSVIASFDQRKQRILSELTELARGATILMDDALLEEVTALTEWPVAYEGSFESEFLSVPQECLILTMQQNQRYFPLADKSGKLLNRFLLVSNLATTDSANIVRGNQRVLRARLSDAKFFFDQDRKTRLETRVPRLADVVYHNRLGSQLERVQRIQKLAGEIARLLGSDAALTERAAYLCKADLITDMVGEFPELQGIMGEYYARGDGEPEAVARAVAAHYRPRFANDAPPEDVISAAVALADKLDTLVGIYGIGLVPTGDKDPFGLRRQALGVLRILIERKFPVELSGLLGLAASRFPADKLSSNVSADLYGFMMERLKGFLRDGGYAPDEIEAVVSQDPQRIDLVPLRLKAVQQFKRLPECQALASANKRIQNILKKTLVPTAEPDPSIMQESAERSLFAGVTEVGPLVHSQMRDGQYAQALTKLAALRESVDTFFDQVMVMVDDARIRDNRLALLNRLGTLMNQVADISKLAA